jgi:triphosphatase
MVSLVATGNRDKDRNRGARRDGLSSQQRPDASSQTPGRCRPGPVSWKAPSVSATVAWNGQQRTHHVPERQSTNICFELDPEDWQRLLHDPALDAMQEGKPREHRVSARYFDTADHDLYLSGISLCLCRYGGQWRQSVVPVGIVNGLSSGRRAHVPVAGEAPELERISETGVRKALAAAAGRLPLVPVFSVERRVNRRLLSYHGSQIVTVLTQAAVCGPERQLSLHRLELTAPHGATELLFELAVELGTRCPLHPTTLGEAARGYHALRSELPRPMKAVDPRLEPDTPVDDALAFIVDACIDQIRGNIPAILESNDPEGVHQMRVGLRRLRSALRVFGKILPEPGTAPVKEQLKWLGSLLGPARDIDVFIDETLAPLAGTVSGATVFDSLQSLASAHRDTAYAAIRTALRSQRFGLCMIELMRWRALHRWRQAPHPSAGAALDKPVRELAPLVLERRDRRIRKEGKRLHDKSAEDKHALRIRIKRLRYAAEFFRQLYPRKSASRYIKHLTALQDSLGHLNDVTTAQAVLATLVAAGAGADRDRLSHAAGFVAGWTAHAVAHGLRRLDRQWSDFLAEEPFWK